MLSVSRKASTLATGALCQAEKSSSNGCKQESKADLPCVPCCKETNMSTLAILCLNTPTLTSHCFPHCTGQSIIALPDILRLSVSSASKCPALSVEVSLVVQHPPTTNGTRTSSHSAGGAGPPSGSPKKVSPSWRASTSASWRKACRTFRWPQWSTNGWLIRTFQRDPKGNNKRSFLQVQRLSKTWSFISLSIGFV